MSHHFIFRTWI